MPEGTMDDDHTEGYRGPATLTVDGRDLPVQVVLDARHEPLDGRLHWFGRVVLDDGAGPELYTALTASTSRIGLSTGAATAEARIGDVDPWGRYRVTGVGVPPFPIEPPPEDD
jgi:hypothetical protein